MYTPAFLWVFISVEKQYSLAEWLTWIEACHPANIELGLERVKQVYDRLAIDLSAATVVTVAGTNGKGSTVSYLRQIYLDAGYSVGCYTSPHFIDYNERISLNGKNATDEQICAAFSLINDARGDIPLTYFEYGTLAALVVFQQTLPDVVLLEVGLGGRLDAVNIVDADLAIITTVAIDHIEWLGDNREVIGFEKAGVFRSNRPAICGDLNPPASVAEHSQNIGATLYQAKVDFSYEKAEQSWSWQGRNAAGESITITDIPLPNLPLQNAATALQAAMLLPLTLSESQVKSSIASAFLTGRMQKVTQGNVTYWLDVAHNPEAAQHLQTQVEQLQGSKTLVLGMLADKDCLQVVDILTPVFDSVHLVGLDVFRGQSAEALAQLMPPDRPVSCHANVAAALGVIKGGAETVDNVIIAGSFFTVSDALTELSGA